MRDYIEAESVLNGREKRKIDNNTYLERRDSAIAVRLHQTDVVTFLKDGAIRFDSGGWRTLTTKDRMNKYSPCSIIQKNSQWYLNGKAFADGAIYKNGHLRGMLKESDIKKTDSLKKQAKKYVDDYWAAFKSGSIPAPSAGDCWFCSMKTDDGKSLGEATKQDDHLKHHIEESYFVPSLIVNAGKAFGVSIMAKNIFAYAWNPEHKDKGTNMEWDIAERQFKSALYRFMKRGLGLAA